MYLQLYSEPDYGTQGAYKGVISTVISTVIID